MRIKELNNREDFYQVLNKTLIEVFFDDELGHLLISEQSNKSLWIANENLNFVASCSISTKSFKYVYSEYGTSRWVLRTLIQRIYVFLSITKITRRLFASKKFDMPLGLREDVIILGGNHRIRLYDSSNCAMYVFLKYGENRDWIFNEMNYRTSQVINYAPRYIKGGTKWFKEEHINGMPLNRLNNKSRIKLIVDRLLQEHYQKTVLNTLKLVDSKKYYYSLYAEIIDFTNSFHDAYSKNKILASMDAINCCLVNIESLHVPVALTHGDFQMGNVLICKGNSYRVIDWESLDERFFLYDHFIMHSNIRQSSLEDFSGYQYLDKVQNFLVLFESYMNLRADSIDNKLFFSLLAMEEIKYSIKNNPNISNGIDTESFIKKIEMLLSFTLHD